MNIKYDVFTTAFLSKITEFDFANILDEDIRNEIVDGYMRRSFVSFKKVCKIDFTKFNDVDREADLDITEDLLDEIVNIISEGMLEQWLKPYAYNQELLQNQLNTRDFTGYSPANLLVRVGSAHQQAKRNFRNMIYQYSYDHGDLTELHL